MVKEYTDFLAGIGASLGPKNEYLEIFWKFWIWTDVLKVFNFWPQLWTPPPSSATEFFASSGAEFNSEQYSDKKKYALERVDGLKADFRYFSPIFL